MKRGLALRFASAWALFLLASVSPHLLARAGLGHWLEASPWSSHFVVKTVLVALAFAAIAYEGQPLSEFGFRRARPWRKRLLLAGLGLGALASLLVFVTPARGMAVLFEGFGFLAVVLSIWLYSSVTEEIFTRGWYQSAVSAEVVAPRVAIASSAILFGTMHLSLLWMGADPWTVVIIVPMTGLLGWAAAVARHSSGSILPAILVHALFNVGGFIAGIVYTILTILRTGGPPAP